MELNKVRNGSVDDFKSSHPARAEETLSVLSITRGHAHTDVYTHICKIVEDEFTFSWKMRGRTEVDWRLIYKDFSVHIRLAFMEDPTSEQLNPLELLTAPQPM